jgi:hypothetical protein
MKGMWVRWECIEKDPKNYKGFKDIYLIINKISPYTITPTDTQLKDYCDKIRKANKNPYISVVSTHFTDKEYLQLIKKYVKMGNIVLDYIRYDKSNFWNIFKMKPINDRVKIAKSYCDINNRKLKIAVWVFPLSFFVGQNYFEMKKYGTLKPMIYPEDIFKNNEGYGNFMTRLYLRLHRVLFPSCEPCIQAWHRKLEDYKKDEKILKNNYSVFRWYWYKKLPSGESWKAYLKLKGN